MFEIEHHGERVKVWKMSGGRGVSIHSVSLNRPYIKLTFEGKHYCKLNDRRDLVIALMDILFPDPDAVEAPDALQLPQSSIPTKDDPPEEQPVVADSSPPGESVFVCARCDKQYKTERGLMNHLKKCEA